jgi:hypothetical protein
LRRSGGREALGCTRRRGGVRPPARGAPPRLPASSSATSPVRKRRYPRKRREGALHLPRPAPTSRRPVAEARQHAQGRLGLRARRGRDSEAWSRSSRCPVGLNPHAGEDGLAGDEDTDDRAIPRWFYRRPDTGAVGAGDWLEQVRVVAESNAVGAVGASRDAEELEPARIMTSPTPGKFYT